MKRVDEIWWCGINPHGVAIWPYLDGTRANVEELLSTNEGKDWKAKGWRVAKLRVVEVST